MIIFEYTNAKKSNRKSALRRVSRVSSKNNFLRNFPGTLLREREHVLKNSYQNVYDPTHHDYHGITALEGGDRLNKKRTSETINLYTIHVYI
jgi:hypothetical protein